VDIIISVGWGKGGFGDLLFALKMASLLKQHLVTNNLPFGEIYVVTDLPRAKNEILSVEGDLEFGVTILDETEYRKYKSNRNIEPLLLIGGPTQSSNIYTEIPRNIQVFLTSEYSMILKEIDIQRLLAPYKKFEKQAKHFCTGLNRLNNEKGILLTPQLIEAAHNPTSVTLRTQFWRQIDIAVRKLLLKNISEVDFNLTRYHSHNNLTFAYSHKETEQFLLLHQGYYQNSSKSQDIFFIIKGGSELIGQLKKMKENFVKNGFSHVTYIDVDNDKEELIHLNNSAPMKMYRLFHCRRISHSQMIALQAVSGDLTGATGDQSLSEAISAGKIIYYECLPHKQYLIKNFMNLLMESLPQESGAIKLTLASLYAYEQMQDYYQLGMSLNNAVIRDCFTRTCNLICQTFDLGNNLFLEVKPVVQASPVTLPMQLYLNGNLEELKPQLTISSEKNLFTFLSMALRSDNLSVVDYIVRHCLGINKQNAVGDTSLILAAQSQNISAIQMLIRHNDKRINIDYTMKNCCDRMLFDYLPIELKSNKCNLLFTLGALVNINLRIEIESITSSSNQYPSSDTEGMLLILKQVVYENDFIKLGALLMLREELSGKSNNIDPLQIKITTLLSNSGVSDMESSYPVDYHKLRQDCRSQFLEFLTKTNQLIESNKWLQPHITPVSSSGPSSNSM
jgi:hypothetical protein